MDSDILEFLPKYSNIHNFDNDLLNPYDNFNISIASKKEFIDEKILKMMYQLKVKNYLKLKNL